MIETVRDTPGLAEEPAASDFGDWSDSPTMEDQNSTATPAGSESELPPRWALERAELQSDVDALVHQALAGLLKSAEDLKQRIREETLAEVQQGRREREAVQREIEDARQELEEVRGGNRAAAQAELEQERETMLADARAEADRIVQAAREERETLLEEIRASQNKLREFQEQIQALLGLGGAPAAAAAAPIAAPVAPEPVSIPEEPPVVPAVASATVAPTPAPAHPAETPIVHEAPAPPTNFSGLIDAAPQAPAPAPVAPPPAPAEPVAVEPATPAGPRTMQLIFTNVPGYQQAAAIERTTRQLQDVSNVDVQEFERGRLVLEVQAGNPSTLADAMIAGAPAEMSVADRSASAITFQLA